MKKTLHVMQKRIIRIRDGEIERDEVNENKLDPTELKTNSELKIYTKRAMMALPA